MDVCVCQLRNDCQKVLGKVLDEMARVDSDGFVPSSQ